MDVNAAPAIGWAAAAIARQDPQAIMASLAADHYITNIPVFNDALRLAYKLAGEGYLVTLGITPTAPETGYGYIRFAGPVSEGFGLKAYQAERFVEKPDLATAQHYLADGHYVWNSSMFVWQVKTILAELHAHLPEVAEKLALIAAVTGTPQEQATLDELWPTFPTISIDNGTREKTKNLVVIPVEIGWSDVGSWEQYGSLFPADQQGIRTVGHHEGLGSQNIFVYNGTARRQRSAAVLELEHLGVAPAGAVAEQQGDQRRTGLASRHTPMA